MITPVEAWEDDGVLGRAVFECTRPRLTPRSRRSSLQVRTAMFVPVGSARALNLLSSRFGAIVPQASSLFPSGKPDTIDQLDAGGVKTGLTERRGSGSVEVARTQRNVTVGGSADDSGGKERTHASEVPHDRAAVEAASKPLTQYARRVECGVRRSHAAAQAPTITNRNVCRVKNFV